jgi:hypothetical protein
MGRQESISIEGLSRQFANRGEVTAQLAAVYEELGNRSSVDLANAELINTVYNMTRRIDVMEKEIKNLRAKRAQVEIWEEPLSLQFH